MDERKRKNTKENKLHILRTVDWLKENYCACQDVCLPRDILYGHYIEFCKKQNVRPSCKATLGKLVRNTFPKVTSKRLGARGQSKYHYSGIGMKACSKHFSNNQSIDGITRFSGSCSRKDRPKIFSLASKAGTMLPNFPDVENMNYPLTVDREKLKIFLTMYKMHCQCIVDVVVGGNFEEIRLFLLHFWQGFPEHLLPIFDHKITRDILLICDSMLHKTLMDILIPTEISEIPEKLLRGIQNIASHWLRWLESSVENMPLQLKCIKMDQAKRFSNSLKRHAAFLHLSQVVRPIFNKFVFQQLIKEILVLMPDILEKVGPINEQLGTEEETAMKFAADLNNLLQNDFTLETLVHWLDDKVLKLNHEEQLLLFWIYALGKMACCLTETRSKYFITFHLLSSFIQEYILLAFENRKSEKEEKQLHFQFDHYLKLRLTSELIKTPTSCFLVDGKRNHLIHEKRKKGPNQNMESHAQNPHLSHTTEFGYWPTFYQGDFVGIDDKHISQLVTASGCSCDYRKRVFPSYTHCCENYNQSAEMSYFYN